MVIRFCLITLFLFISSFLLKIVQLLIIINTNKIHVGEHYMNDTELHELQKKITNKRLMILRH